MAKKCCADNNFNENIHGLMCHYIHSCCVMQYHITAQDDDGGDYCYIIICTSNAHNIEYTVRWWWGGVISSTSSTVKPLYSGHLLAINLQL